MSALGSPSTAQTPYFDPTLQVGAMTSLPKIRGTWYFVDPKVGLSTNSGIVSTAAFDSVLTAYNACVDGAGDGIAVLSYVAAGSTSANTTSYLVQQLVWAKSNITVVGVNSGNIYFNRSRIANKDIVTGPVTTISQQANSITRTTGSFLTDGWVVGMKGYTADSGSNNGATFTITVATALVLTITETFNVQSAGSVGSCTMTSYCPSLVSVTGNNNLFYGIEIANYGTQAGAIGGLVVSGVRNHFVNSMFVGGGGCATAATTRSVEIGTGARDNVFDDCVIGTDTVDRGNNANGELYLNASAADGRLVFNFCTFTSYTSTGTAHGMIKSAAATAMGRNVILNSCIIEHYAPNLAADQASMFIGTGLGSAKIILANTPICGFAYADSSTTNKCVFVQGAPASLTTGLGGVMVTKST